MSQTVSHVAVNEDMLRMQRLILEGLEVALHLCNTFLNYSGPNRIIDILSQLLPTAYFVNTGYWPFYETESGNSMCVCRIFDLSCDHQTSTQSRINLERDIGEPFYFKAQHVKITFTYLEIDIRYPKKDGNLVLLKNFEIIIKYKIKQFWNNGEFNDYRCLEDIFVNVLSCKFLNLEKAIKHFCIFIKPHPLGTPLYGHYLPTLLYSYGGVYHPQVYVVSWERCPRYTVKVVDYTSGIINEEDEPETDILL